MWQGTFGHRLLPHITNAPLCPSTATAHQIELRHHPRDHKAGDNAAGGGEAPGGRAPQARPRLLHPLQPAAAQPQRQVSEHVGVERVCAGKQ